VRYSCSAVHEAILRVLLLFPLCQAGRALPLPLKAEDYVRTIMVSRSATPLGLLIQYISRSRTLSIGASDLFLMASRCLIVKGKGLYKGMVLKLASDEVQEVQRALSAAYLQVLRELSRGEGVLSHQPGLELCQRKWKLEALLHQLDHSGDPPPVLELAPAASREASQSEAA